jgi:hypothetical protein
VRFVVIVIGDKGFLNMRLNTAVAPPQLDDSVGVSTSI